MTKGRNFDMMLITNLCRLRVQFHGKIWLARRDTPFSIGQFWRSELSHNMNKPIQSLWKQTDLKIRAPIPNTVFVPKSVRELLSQPSNYTTYCIFPPYFSISPNRQLRTIRKTEFKLVCQVDSQSFVDGKC